jgi:hypothetical protein
MKSEEATIEKVMHEVRAELMRALALHSQFNSAHEGYAVILEELDELKTEVWKKRKERDGGAMREEAIQIAAMACRFVLDLCEP